MRERLHAKIRHDAVIMQTVVASVLDKEASTRLKELLEELKDVG